MLDRRLTVQGVRFLSPRYFVLSLDGAEIAARARPGQFVMISVSDGIDPLLRRPMAVYGIRQEEGRPVGLDLLIESHGRGTRLLAHAEPGDTAWVLGPLGNCFDIDAEADVEHLLVMGGVGAAPFPLLARRLRRAGCRARAFIGGRTAADLLCVEEFEQLGVPVHSATEDGSAGHHGLVTEPLRQVLEGLGEGAQIYSCGPTPMMRAVDAIARPHRLRHQVSLEAPMACGIGICLSCVVRVVDADGWTYRRICREGPVFDASHLTWGRTVDA